ncbi:ABC transporter ATP-binding protein [Neorhizobium petrolearium]|uniref:ABC transporter ATP-binding protein n=1 Tax=Neorhizobium petrolearium TaxID=515361 RepID=UPI003F181A30
MPQAETVLTVDGLTVGTARADLVIDVSIEVRAGETLCLVGESGCGKSLTCLAAMGLTPESLTRKTGQISFLGDDLSRLNENQLADIRGRDMAMIFQDAMAALNPVRRVGMQIAEVLVVHRGLTWRQAEKQAIDLLASVGIADPQSRAKTYPHQLSGGMCQRVMIAMALACRPKLLIADEATTALDVTTQAQILKLMRELQAETGAAMIFVTHDLGVVAEIADRVAVMYSGRVVENAVVDDLFEGPQHPYTRGLMACRLHAASESHGRIAAIEGTVPSPARRPEGCSFRPRCPHAAEQCIEPPALRPVRGGHWAACHFAGDFV